MITINSNGIRELVRRGSWFPPGNNLMWIAILVPLTVVALPVIAALKVRAWVVTRPHRDIPEYDR